MAKPRPKPNYPDNLPGFSGILPRIDSVSCAVPSVQTGDSIVIFGKNFSPHPFENLIVVSATPTMPPPPGDLVTEIGVGKASLNRLESVAIIDNLPPANYSVSVKVKGMYSNPVQVNFVLPQLSNPVSGVVLPPKPQQCPQPANTFGPGGNALAKGDKLLPGDFLISNNGRWRLDYNTGDGNLILHNTKTGNIVWGADEANKIQYPNTAPGVYPPPYPFLQTDSELRSGNPEMMPVPDLMMVHYCIMRDDGHLVMIQGVEEVGYVAGGKVPPTIDPYNGPSPWHSNNDDAPGAFFRVEDNGQICIYDQNADDCVIWRHGLAA